MTLGGLIWNVGRTQYGSIGAYLLFVTYWCEAGDMFNNKLHIQSFVRDDCLDFDHLPRLTAKHGQRQPHGKHRLRLNQAATALTPAVCCNHNVKEWTLGVPTITRTEAINSESAIQLLRGSTVLECLRIRHSDLVNGYQAHLHGILMFKDIGKWTILVVTFRLEVSHIQRIIVSLSSPHALETKSFSTKFVTAGLRQALRHVHLLDSIKLLLYQLT